MRNFHSGSRRKRPLAPQEHGDWRVPLENPAEAEHWQPKPLSYWNKVHLRVSYLESASTAEWMQSAESADDWQPIRGWQRWLRLAVAYGVLLPLSVVMVFALLVQLYHAAPTFEQFSFWYSEPVWFSVMGLLLFLFLKFARAADAVLVFVYVVGHELTHAIAAKLSFGHVETMKFDLSGGYIETDADNLFIALSPYFTPLWMLCWMALLWLLNLALPLDSFSAWFYGGCGFWWAFHLYWTGWIIPREQPDMLENGLVLSMLITLLMNIVVLVGILWAFGVMSLQGYREDFLSCAQELGLLFRDIAVWCYHSLKA